MLVMKERQPEIRTIAGWATLVLLEVAVPDLWRLNLCLNAKVDGGQLG